MRKFLEALCDRFALLWVTLTSPAETVSETNTSIMKLYQNAKALVKEFWLAPVLTLLSILVFTLVNHWVSELSLLASTTANSNLTNFVEKGQSVCITLFYAEMVLILFWPTGARYFTGGRSPDPNDNQGMQEATKDSFSKGVADLTSIGRLIFFTGLLLALYLVVALTK